MEYLIAWLMINVVLHVIVDKTGDTDALKELYTRPVLANGDYTKFIARCKLRLPFALIAFALVPIGVTLFIVIFVGAPWIIYKGFIIIKLVSHKLKITKLAKHILYKD